MIDDKLKALEKKIDAIHLDIRTFITTIAKHEVKSSWLRGGIKVCGGVLLALATGAKKLLASIILKNKQLKKEQ